MENDWGVVRGEKILKVPSNSLCIHLPTDFTSDFTRFLANNGGAQLNIGGAEALTKRYKITHGLAASKLTLRDTKLTEHELASGNLHVLKKR